MARIVGAGLMTGYLCTAQCRHCLYGCSYHGKKEFITPKKGDEVLRTLKDAGVYSLHIGGGEPFLDFDSLVETIRSMNRYHIAVDYIETNAYWCYDKKSAVDKLTVLKKLGVDTVMASVDPFHIEYVPLSRPLLMCEAAREVGIGYFVWQDRFLRRLLPLDPNRVHTEEELKSLLGENYLLDTAKEYGVGMNGRALSLARKLYPLRPAKEVASKKPCSRILRGQHCHIDMYGNVIPAGCTGISIPLTEYLEETSLFDPERYPVLSRLLTEGTKGLLAYAQSLGFDGETPCATNCDLCYRIRCFLREKAPAPEVGPDCFYEMMNGI